MGELIKFYFQKINRTDLLGDPNIRFLLNAKLIIHDSKDLIKTYLNQKNIINVIIVDDLEDKLDQIKN